MHLGHTLSSRRNLSLPTFSMIINERFSEILRRNIRAGTVSVSEGAGGGRHGPNELHDNYGQMFKKLGFETLKSPFLPLKSSL